MLAGAHSRDMEPSVGEAQGKLPRQGQLVQSLEEEWQLARQQEECQPRPKEEGRGAFCSERRKDGSKEGKKGERRKEAGQAGRNEGKPMWLNLRLRG